MSYKDTINKVQNELIEEKFKGEFYLVDMEDNVHITANLISLSFDECVKKIIKTKKCKVYATEGDVDYNTLDISDLQLITDKYESQTHYFIF